MSRRERGGGLPVRPFHPLTVVTNTDLNCYRGQGQRAQSEAWAIGVLPWPDFFWQVFRSFLSFCDERLYCP